MTDQPKPKRKLIIFVKVCVAIVLAVIVIHTIAVVTTGASVREAKASILEKGYPMTAAEIIPKPVPDDENAAVELKKVFGLFTLGGDDTYSPGKSSGTVVEPFAEFEKTYPSGGTVSFDTPYDDETLRKLETLFSLKEFEQVFTLLTAASKKDRCYFEHDYDDGPHMLLPELSHIRRAARLLSVRAKYEAQRGNRELAIEKVRESLILSNSLADEPILISQLVRLACLNISLQGALFVSSLHPLTEVEIASIKKASLPFLDSTPIELSFHGERILMGQWCFELKGEENKVAEAVYSEGGPRILKYYSSYPLRPLFNVDYTTYLNLMTQYSEILETGKENDLAGDLEVGKHIKRYAILTGMLLPALDAVRYKMGSTKAIIQMYELGIACNQYKHKNGSYPESLNVIASGADLADAFTGEPFVYKSTSEAIIIYSRFEKYRGSLTVDGKERVLGVKLLK